MANEDRILIGNQETYIRKANVAEIRVDRGHSALANTFIPKYKSEQQRNWACDAYQEWFDQQVADGNPKVMAELERILGIAVNQQIVLLCWCYPLRCHSMTIRDWLLERLE